MVIAKAFQEREVSQVAKKSSGNTFVSFNNTSRVQTKQTVCAEHWELKFLHVAETWIQRARMKSYSFAAMDLSPS